jgi:hypothetical protein
VALNPERAPPNRPTGVRIGSQVTTSLMPSNLCAGADIEKYPLVTD